MWDNAIGYISGSYIGRIVLYDSEKTYLHTNIILVNFKRMIWNNKLNFRILYYEIFYKSQNKRSATKSMTSYKGN